MHRLLLIAALSVCALAARAADRPYIVANSGAAEEDEEQVWSVENWYRVAGRQKSFTFAPEYAFNPDNSLQAEFRRVVDRDNGDGHELELEYKHLFNRIARDGWGWGVVLALDFQRPEGGPWSRTAASLSLPLTVQVGESDTSLVHLNVGVAKPREDRRVVTGVLAGEHEVWRRVSLFAELARDAEGSTRQIGVRHWIKRERLALDVAWQRVRGDEAKGSGLVLGLAWYDL